MIPDDIPRSLRAAFRTAVFLLKVMPTLPSRLLNLLTATPIVERLEYSTATGQAEGDVYRPSCPGRHPGVVVCMGVVPFGEEHPQVARLGEALARAGFAALLYWSPAMRDFRLDAEDIESIALAYQHLLNQPYVDEGSSGLLGLCVGGSFALMAAASPRIRDRVDFVAAFDPYSSLLTLAVDVASSTVTQGEARAQWPVDPLTHKVFVHSITAPLSPLEAERLRRAVLLGEVIEDEGILSTEGRAIQALLAARDYSAAKKALRQLPEEIRAGLQALSPLDYVQDLRADLIAISHDRDDEVIPVGESRRLVAALRNRKGGVRYAEFEMFQHADPTKRKLSLPRLIRQLVKFYLWLYSVFKQAAR